MLADNTTLKELFRSNIRPYTMIAALIVIWAIFALATDGLFLSPRNLSNLFLQTVTVAIVACGMVLVIVTGNIDLSVGSVAGFCGAVGAVLQVNCGWGTPSTILAVLLTGLIIGAWHGFWVAFKKVPAFIVTLASMLAFRGAILGVTGGATISPMRDSFKEIGSGYIPDLLTPKGGFNDTSAFLAAIVIILFVWFEIRQRKQKGVNGFQQHPLWIDAGRIIIISLAIAGAFSIMIFNEGIPYAVLVLMAVVLLFSFIGVSTVFGRRLYAIGGNPDAALLSGISIQKNIMALYMIFGSLTALAGIVMTARLNAATTSAGMNMELDAIAAAVIGGTSLLGGEGTITGAVIGALIMSSLDNGMSLMNIDITWQYVIKGLILLTAVWADISMRNRKV